MTSRNQKNDPHETTLVDQFTLFATDSQNGNNRKKSPPAYQKGRLHLLDVAELLPDPSQPRQTLDNERLEALSLSVRKHGVLEPVLFRQAENGQLFVVAGSRRLEAARRARISKIPAVLADGDAAEIALVENLLRQDLTCIEESEAIEALKLRHGYTLAELASILGKSVSIMSEIISLTRLPVSLRDLCRGDHDLARSILVEIAKLPSEQEMLDTFERFRNEGLSRSALRKRETAPAQKKPGYTRLFRSFTRQVNKIDVVNLADKERTRVKKELEVLKGVIEENLAKLQ